MKILVGILLLITVILVAGCVKPPTLGQIPDEVEETVTVVENTEEITKQIEQPSEEQLAEKETTVKKSSPATEKKEVYGKGRIDVTTLGESSQIAGTVNGRTFDFTVAYTDKDAIAFDIHEKWGISLNEARLITFVDNNPLLRPSEKAELTEEFSSLAVEEEFFESTENTRFTNITFDVTREEGVLRGVGCNFDEKLIKFKVYNPFNEPLPFFQDVRPRIKGAIAFYVNNRLIIPSCEGKQALEFNESVDCVKANVFFVRSKDSNVIYDAANFESTLNDSVNIKRPGLQEALKFECTPVIEEQI